MIDLTKYRAASGNARRALDRLDRLAEQLDGRGIAHALLHDWRGHTLVERLTYEAGEIAAELGSTAIGSALPDQDLRCDDCRGLLLRGSCPDCAPQVSQ